MAHEPLEVARYFVRPHDPNPGLTCVGYGTKLERDDCGPRTWPYFGAVFVRSGRGRFESSATSGEIPVGPGTLLWQFPGVTHLYGPDTRGWHERWIVFEGPVADAFVELGFLDPASPVVTHAEHPSIVRVLDRIHAVVAEGGPLAPLIAGAQIHQLILAVHQRATIGAGGDDPDVILTEATVRLERDAFQAVDPAAVARDLGMGYSTFRRRFKAATGSSPKRYVLSIRLARAKELLATTDATITSIAHEIGFDDPYYFSRLFRDREGRSPTEFRADHRVHVEP